MQYSNFFFPALCLRFRSTTELFLIKQCFKTKKQEFHFHHQNAHDLGVLFKYRCKYLAKKETLGSVEVRFVVDFFFFPFFFCQNRDNYKMDEVLLLFAICFWNPSKFFSFSSSDTIRVKCQLI